MGSCSKDCQECKKTLKEDPIVYFTILPKWQEENFQIDSTYLNHSNEKIAITKIKANLTIKPIKSNDSLVHCDQQYYLVDLDDPSSFQNIPVNWKSGQYKGFQIAIGLDTAVNHVDPAQYSSEHPLSIFKNDHWDWSGGYRFLTLEGFNNQGDDSSNLSNPMLFHVGLDTLYSPKKIDLNLNINKEDRYNLFLNWNIDEFFTAVDSIDLQGSQVTHTLNNFDLAQKIITNAAASFHIP